MGCVQSVSKRARARVRSADDGGGKKPSCTPTSHTSANSLLREKAITRTERAADGVGGNRRRQEEKQHGGRSSPEAELPINWNLRFKDLVILEHIANG